MSGANWKAMSALLEKLKDVDPESARRVVQAYMTKVLLNPRDKGSALQAIDVLTEFSKPFSSSEGLAPLVLACARLEFLRD
jgi:hypothetical protein